MYCPSVFIGTENNQNLFKSHIIDKTEEKIKNVKSEDPIKRELFPNKDIENILKQENKMPQNEEKEVKIITEEEEVQEKNKENIVISKNKENLKRKSRETKNHKKKSKK